MNGVYGISREECFTWIRKRKLIKVIEKHLNEFMRKVENKMNKHVFMKEKKWFLIRDFIRNKKKWFTITVNWLAIRESRIANWNPDWKIVGSNLSGKLQIDGNLVVQSKMRPRSGSVALRQVNPIHKKGL